MIASKVIITMADGSERDMSGRFTAMDDTLFAKIVTATVSAGKTAPIRWEYREYNVNLSASDKADAEYDRHNVAVKKAMSY